MVQRCLAAELCCHESTAGRTQQQAVSLSQAGGAGICRPLPLQAAGHAAALLAGRQAY